MNGLDAWVYRDGRRTVDGAAAARDLATRLARTGAATGDRRRREAVDALVACGMLEAGAADAAHPSASSLATLSDALAEAALGGTVPLPRTAAALVLPDALAVSTPEGFAYYALHPEGYARATAALDARGRVLVVGIRSIGTTLSAIACAALRRRGIDASRITVRPTGSPYDRRLDLDDGARRAAAAATDVVIVDEGPGLSGSTFLATAEAVERAGSGAVRITMMCSHAPPTERLIARDAAARWRRFRTVVAPPDAHVRFEGYDLSGGAWRARRWPDASQWPSVFVQAERRKVLACGRLYKFEGLGPSGEAVRLRALALAEDGWAPAPRDEGDGWVSYPWLEDRGPAPSLDRLARYCAARPVLCPASSEPEDLRPMVAKNAALLLGEARTIGELPIERAVVVDGRMDRHEWVGDLKTDGAADGDGHFFPGPTDIAWDLAGVIVEHALDEARRQAFLDAYRAASGDDASRRIHAWIVAYAAFRGGLAALACASARGTTEEARLARDVARYRGVCRAGLPPA